MTKIFQSLSNEKQYKVKGSVPFFLYMDIKNLAGIRWPQRAKNLQGSPVAA